MDKAEGGKEAKETEQVMEGDSVDAQADAVRKLIQQEVTILMDKEITKAAHELLEEQRMAIQQVVEEQRKIIREVVEETKKALWAGPVEEQRKIIGEAVEDEEKQAVWAGVVEMKDSISRIGLR